MTQNGEWKLHMRWGAQLTFEKARNSSCLILWSPWGGAGEERGARETFGDFGFAFAPAGRGPPP